MIAVAPPSGNRWKRSQRQFLQGHLEVQLSEYLLHLAQNKEATYINIASWICTPLWGKFKIRFQKLHLMWGASPKDADVLCRC